MVFSSKAVLRGGSGTKLNNTLIKKRKNMEEADNGEGNKRKREEEETNNPTTTHDHEETRPAKAATIEEASVTHNENPNNNVVPSVPAIPSANSTAGIVTGGPNNGVNPGLTLGTLNNGGNATLQRQGSHLFYFAQQNRGVTGPITVVVPPKGDIPVVALIDPTPDEIRLSQSKLPQLDCQLIVPPPYDDEPECARCALVVYAPYPVVWIWFNTKEKKVDKPTIIAYKPMLNTSMSDLDIATSRGDLKQKAVKREFVTGLAANGGNESVPVNDPRRHRWKSILELKTRVPKTGKFKDVPATWTTWDQDRPALEAALEKEEATDLLTLFENIKRGDQNALRAGNGGGINNNSSNNNNYSGINNNSSNDDLPGDNLNDSNSTFGIVASSSM